MSDIASTRPLCVVASGVQGHTLVAAQFCSEVMTWLAAGVIATSQGLPTLAATRERGC